MLAHVTLKDYTPSLAVLATALPEEHVEHRLGWQRRAREILLWAVTVLIALGIGLVGVAKFLQPDHWRQLFTGWGYPGWFSSVVGVIEVVGAVGLLVPRLASYGAILLGVVMLAALLTLLRHPGGPLGWGATPTVYIVLLAVIAASRWRQRTAVGSTLPGRSRDTA
jgi:putative oxidoreductase